MPATSSLVWWRRAASGKTARTGRSGHHGRSPFDLVMVQPHLTDVADIRPRALADVAAGARQRLRLGGPGTEPLCCSGVAVGQIQHTPVHHAGHRFRVVYEPTAGRFRPNTDFDSPIDVQPYLIVTVVPPVPTR